jgi:hypothetical protein
MIKNRGSISAQLWDWRNSCIRQLKMRIRRGAFSAKALKMKKPDAGGGASGFKLDWQLGGGVLPIEYRAALGGGVRRFDDLTIQHHE